ncbi:sensor histidine kinase [Cryptosporangium phraense]|uniref:histidine kinase n=1 Tax=Cryptosporangium phraense TaxID=2593070 RepID=A0A545ATM0_9ACTN|nr:ATP-binding protein [Cryptosporangium phraense]TQS44688.1 hypothetical protein FL583_11985 [Cryptosporangium phraense]
MASVRRWGGDVLLWLLLSALLPLNGARIDEGPYVRGLLVAALVLAVATGVRRVAPLASLVLAAGLVAVDPWLAAPFAVLSFLAGRSALRPRPALWTYAGLAGGGAGLAFGLAVLRGTDRWTAYYVLTEIVLCGVVPWLAGRYLRQRRELVEGGWALAEELERGHALVADRARLRERARIAEDMHDALGHELSLLALRAGALELDPSLGPAQREAAAGLRLGAAAATERLRAVIGVLRASDPAPLAPVDETLATLIDRVRGAGLTIAFSDGGAAGEPGLPPLADRALYRVVQEALTNAARHAPGAPVTVRLTATPDAVTVTVTNPLTPEAPPAGRSGAERPDPAPGRTGGPGGEGSGLVGLAERVRLVGGTLTAGVGGGTFTVTATVPRAAGGAVAAGPERPRSDSAGRRAAARRRTRRDLVLTVVVPVLAGAVLVGVVVGGYAIEVTGSVLRPADAARLHPGQSRADAEALLPWLQATERPAVAEPPRPPGAECRYYGTSAELFPPVRDVYRVCFAHDRVVGVDLIPGRTARGGTP